jgi:predicted permease
MTVLLMVLSKHPLATLDAPTAIFAVLPAVVIFGGTIAFGVLNIRRAFAGRP